MKTDPVYHTFGDSGPRPVKSGKVSTQKPSGARRGKEARNFCWPWHPCLGKYTRSQSRVRVSALGVCVCAHVRVCVDTYVYVRVRLFSTVSMEPVDIQIGHSWPHAKVVYQRHEFRVVGLHGDMSPQDTRLT